MTQKETHADETEQSSLLNLIPRELAAMGKRRIEELAEAQSALFGKCQEVKQNWFDRIQSEGTIGSEIAAKLTATRSMSEATTAYRDWIDKHIEMATEYAKCLLAIGQQFMEMRARLVSSGRLCLDIVPRGQLMKRSTGWPEQLFSTRHVS